MHRLLTEPVVVLGNYLVTTVSPVPTAAGRGHHPMHLVEMEPELSFAVLTATRPGLELISDFTVRLNCQKDLGLGHLALTLQLIPNGYLSIHHFSVSRRLSALYCHVQW